MPTKHNGWKLTFSVFPERQLMKPAMCGQGVLCLTAVLGTLWHQHRLSIHFQTTYIYLAATWCKNLYVIWYPLVLYHHLASLCVLCVSFVWVDWLLTQSWLLSVCIPSNTHPDNGLTTACAVYTVFTANWVEGQDLRGAAINSNIVVVNIHATKCWCERHVVL